MTSLTFSAPACKKFLQLASICQKLSKYIKLQYARGALTLLAVSEGEASHMSFKMLGSFFAGIGPSFEATFDSKQLMAALRTISLTAVDKMNLIRANHNAASQAPTLPDRMMESILTIDFTCSYGVTSTKRITEVENIGGMRVPDIIGNLPNRLKLSSLSLSRILESFPDTSKTAVVGITFAPDVDTGINVSFRSYDLLSRLTKNTTEVVLASADLQQIDLLVIPTHAIVVPLYDLRIFVNAFPEESLNIQFGQEGEQVVMSHACKGPGDLQTLAIFNSMVDDHQTENNRRGNVTGQVGQGAGGVNHHHHSTHYTATQIQFTHVTQPPYEPQPSPQHHQQQRQYSQTPGHIQVSQHTGSLQQHGDHSQHPLQSQEHRSLTLDVDIFEMVASMNEQDFLFNSNNTTQPPPLNNPVAQPQSHANIEPPSDSVHSHHRESSNGSQVNALRQQVTITIPPTPASIQGMCENFPLFTGDDVVPSTPSPDEQNNHWDLDQLW